MNTVSCTACHRPIRADSPYAARRKGPKCGGRIKRSRKPAIAHDVGHHGSASQCQGQLELPEDEEVSQ